MITPLDRIPGDSIGCNGWRHNLGPGAGASRPAAGRYKAMIVDGSGNGYLRTVGEYVHLNPVRARLLKPDQKLRTYQWSSFPFYLISPARRPTWPSQHVEQCALLAPAAENRAD